MVSVTVRTILEDNEIKPNKIRYYLERKDPEFESKIHDVLLVYKQIEMCFDKEGNLLIDMDEPKTVTVSYDEKPGIQALKNIAPDLPPAPGHGKVSRDYEYKRPVTLYLAISISTYVIVEGCHCIEIEFRDITITFLFGQCITRLFFQKTVARSHSPAKGN